MNHARQCTGCHYRRRHRGVQHRLPPDQAGMEGCPHPGKGRVDQRLHLACGGPGGTAPFPPERDADASAQRQPLRDAGGGDGSHHGLETLRLSASGQHGGSALGAEERGHHGAQLRLGDAHDHALRGAEDLPDPRYGRDRRRGLHALRRPGGSERPDHGAGQRGDEPRRHGGAEDPGYRLSRSRTTAFAPS